MSEKLLGSEPHRMTIQRVNDGWVIDCECEEFPTQLFPSEDEAIANAQDHVAENE